MGILENQEIFKSHFAKLLYFQQSKVGGALETSGDLQLEDILGAFPTLKLPPSRWFSSKHTIRYLPIYAKSQYAKSQYAKSEIWSKFSNFIFQNYYISRRFSKSSDNTNTDGYVMKISSQRFPLIPKTPRTIFCAKFEKF